MREDTLSVFQLEKFLIPDDKWDEFYPEMPPRCQRLVDEMKVDKFSQGGPIGIGFKEGFGWFILETGQGPFIAWTEHDLDGEFINTGEI